MPPKEPSLKVQRLIEKSKYHTLPKQTPEPQPKNNSIPRSPINLIDPNNSVELSPEIFSVLHEHLSSTIHNESSITNNPFLLFRLNEYSKKDIMFLDSQYKFLEPRDQKIIIPFVIDSQAQKLFNDLKLLEKKVTKWVSQMYSTILSTAFKFLTSMRLSMDETKIFCSENIIINILLLVKDYLVASQKIYIGENLISKLAQISEQYETKNKVDKKLALIQFIVKVINKKLKECSDYMLVKYPQTQTIMVNKRVREALVKVNILEFDDQYDMIFKSKIQFRKKKFKNISHEAKEKNMIVQRSEKDYIPQIMKFLNYLIEIPSKKIEPTNEDSATYYQLFSQLTEAIYSWIQVPQSYMNQQSVLEHLWECCKTAPGSDSKKEQSQPSIKKSKWKKFEEGHLSKIFNASQNTQFSLKDLDKYKQNVKNYSDFKVNQKISPYTPLYSEEQIHNNIYSVKDTGILRVLNKWGEELRKKLKNPKQLIYKRFHGFKPRKGKEFINLSYHDKNSLYEQIVKEEQKMENYLKQRKTDCLNLESILTLQVQNLEQTNIPKIQYMTGRFCGKLESASSTYQFNYVSNLIESLLEAPYKNIKQIKPLKANKNKTNINLLTFKVPDLIRCKFESKENEIIRICNLLSQIYLNPNWEQYLKIVKVEDRLETPDMNVIFTVMFMNKILCEIVLKVKEQKIQKQKLYGSFNTYIKGLFDSEFGPLIELSYIWAHLDKRSQFFLSRSQLNKVQKFPIQINHQCTQIRLVDYRYPFVCSQCYQYFPALYNIISNMKCAECDHYFICGNCIFDKSQYKVQMEFCGFNGAKVSKFTEFFELWNSLVIQERNKEILFELIKQEKGKRNLSLPDYGIMIPKNGYQKKFYVFQKIFVKKLYIFVNIKCQAQNKKEGEVKILYTFNSDNEQEDIKQLIQKYFIISLKDIRSFSGIQQSQHSQALEIQRKKKLEKQEKQFTIQKQLIEQQIKEIDDQLKVFKQKKVLLPEQKSDKKKLRQKKQAKKRELDNLYLSDRINRRDLLGQFGPIAEEGLISGSDSQEPPLNQNVTNNVKMIFDQQIKDEKVGNRSRTNSQRGASSVSERSHQSIGSTVSNKISEYEEPGTQLQRFSKKNYYIDSRVLNKKKNSLYLGLFMKEALIKAKIRQSTNLSNIIECIDTGVQVLYLEDKGLKNQLNQFKKIKIREIQYYERVMKETGKKINMFQLQKKFKQFREIYISDNRISDLGFVKKLKAPKILNANYNYIKSMEPVRQKNMQQILLSNNFIPRISGLDFMNKLTILVLDKNQICELTNLTDLFSLEKLSLFSNKIRKIQGLDSLKQLKYLDLSCNKIKKIEGLTQTSKLMYLNLSANMIEKIENLDLPNLKSLYLSANMIEKIENLESMIALQQLDLSKNAIMAIDGMPRFSQLIELHLKDNLIRKIQNISHFPKLSYLNLAKNRITVFDSWVVQVNNGLMNVKQLNLSFNLISRLESSPFMGLKKLETLRINNNIFDVKHPDNQNSLKNIAMRNNIKNIYGVTLIQQERKINENSHTMKFQQKAMTEEQGQNSEGSESDEKANSSKESEDQSKQNSE